MKLVQASNDPAKILTTPTEPVTDFNEAPTLGLQVRTGIRIFGDLVGLAANQIGINKAVCVVYLDGGEKPQWLTMVNPKIVSYGTRRVKDWEGCGSLREPTPLYVEVSRPDEVGVEFFNESGQKMGINLQGFDARVTQHEIDHLNGHLITEYGQALTEAQRLALTP